MELKIANAQVIINYAAFLEENKYFEESFKVSCRILVRRIELTIRCTREGSSYSISRSLSKFGTSICPNSSNDTAERSSNERATYSNRLSKIALRSSANPSSSCMPNSKKSTVSPSALWGYTTEHLPLCKIPTSSKCSQFTLQRLPPTLGYPPLDRYTSERWTRYLIERRPTCAGDLRRWRGSLERLIGLGRFTRMPVNSVILGSCQSSGKSGMALKVSTHLL